MSETNISIQARAKINLYLHVLGKLESGYHSLDSLFAFANIGDTVTVFPSPEFHFEITGEFASGLPVDNTNSVVKATFALARQLGKQPNVGVLLKKEMPLSSGIGAGSADAAATLQALELFWNTHLDPNDLNTLALSLGADVPSCLISKAVYVSGIGEKLTPVSPIPTLDVVLINPRRPVSTPNVFKSRPPLFSQAMPLIDKMDTLSDIVAELKKRHNDLTDSACLLEPSIKTVLASLDSCEGCLLSRMSGSGATCWGIFENATKSALSTQRLRNKHPLWWVRSAKLT